MRMLLTGYRGYDRKNGFVCDLDEPFLAKLTSNPCTYCKTTEDIGADRIDNTIGHLKTNVVPCCLDCNRMRSNKFTYEEMLRIGQVTAIIKLERKLNVAKTV